MTDKITLAPVGTLIDATTAASTINNNFGIIQTAFDDTLSRDGTIPNTMNANIDMNSNQILNLPAPAGINSPARLIDVMANPTVSVPPVGTSGAVVGLLNANKTDSGNNTYSGTAAFSGNVSFFNPVQFNNTTTLPSGVTFVAPNLGTPASGTVTHLTGTASININGTVGATTPASGKFTSVTSVADGAHGGGQVTVLGATDGNKQAWLGYDTTLDRGFVQSIHQTSGATDLMLQPNGGNVRVGDVNAATATISSSGTIDATTSILTKGAGGIGYKVGSGGSVIQLTSKATGVTINTTCGQIQTNNSSLSSAAGQSFTVTNSSVAATDNIILSLASGNATAGTYSFWIDKVSAGSFVIMIVNRSGGSLSEALVLNFAILKSVIT